MTKEELNETGNKEMLIRLIDEKLGKLTTYHSPLSLKLKKLRQWVDKNVEATNEN